MFLKEAVWINGIIKNLIIDSNTVILDLGSSSEQFRCLEQPHIDYFIFRPLGEARARIIHIDQKKEEGVDIVCDLHKLNANTLEKGDVVICSSVLEHVENPVAIVNIIKELTNPGGIIIISVPHVFKYHPDPIDTMYRPSNKELEEFFPEHQYTRIASEIVEIDEQPFVRTRNILFRLINKILKRLTSRSLPLFQPVIIKNKVSLLAVKRNQ